MLIYDRLGGRIVCILSLSMIDAVAFYNLHAFRCTRILSQPAYSLKRTTGFECDIALPMKWS